MNDITLQQIEIFVAVAERESLAGAAKELYLDSASVSRWVSRLEATLGVSLFTRTNHGVELTDDGRFFYYTFKPVLKHIRSAINSRGRRYMLSDNVLHIGCSDFDEIIDFIGPVISRFECEHPEILVNFEVMGSRELQESLVYNYYDLIVCYSSMGNYLEFNRKHVHKFDSYLLLSADNEAINGDEIDFTKLEGMDFYRTIPPEMEETEGRILSLCRSLGFTPGKFKYVPSQEMIALTVRSGQGFSIGGKTMAGKDTSVVRAFKIDNPYEAQHLDLVWNKFREKTAVKAFVESIEGIKD